MIPGPGIRACQRVFVSRQEGYPVGEIDQWHSGVYSLFQEEDSTHSRSLLGNVKGFVHCLILHMQLLIQSLFSKLLNLGLSQYFVDR